MKNGLEVISAVLMFLCGTISTLGSDRGWVKISAEASDERKVEGWLHEVYANMLASKCGRQDLGEEPEVAEVPAVGSNVVSVEEPDMHPSETSLVEVSAVVSDVVSVEEPIRIHRKQVWQKFPLSVQILFLLRSRICIRRKQV